MESTLEFGILLTYHEIPNRFTRILKRCRDRVLVGKNCVHRAESQMSDMCFASKWLDQVALLDGTTEAIRHDTRSAAVMAMLPSGGTGVLKRRY